MSNTPVCINAYGRCQQTAPCQHACQLRITSALPGQNRQYVRFLTEPQEPSKEAVLSDALRKIERFCITASKTTNAESGDLLIDLEFVAKVAGEALRSPGA